MRFLIVLIIVVLLAWKFWPEQPVPTAEESFIGPQIQSLNKADQVGDAVIEAADRKKQEIEEQSDGG